MTAELTAFHERADAAERVGDLEEALEYHLGIPMFVRSRHRSMLEQLIAVEEPMPPWVWARWIVYVALRTEGEESLAGRLHRAALMEAVGTFHADLMDAAYDTGRDPIRVTSQVMGESWGCHQLIAYERGVVDALLDEFVGGRLAEHAALARTWADAPMGGYRVEGPTSGCAVVVRDLLDGRATEVLDLGAACLVGPDRTVIGRLVPSGTKPATMFDVAPLPVDAHLAREVAWATRDDGWVDVLSEAIEDGRLDSAHLIREDYELLSDIPSLDLLAFGTPATELPRVMEQLRSGRDEVGRAAFRVLRSAAEGSLNDEAAPYVAAACLNVHAHEDARRRILGPGQRTAWQRWAGLVPDPARLRLLEYAEATAQVA